MDHGGILYALLHYVLLLMMMSKYNSESPINKVISWPRSQKLSYIQGMSRIKNTQ